MVAQEDWRQWRGPTADGVAANSNPATSWSEEENIKWKIAVPGRGGSTPIVLKDRIYVLTAINTGRVDPSFPKPEDQPDRVFGIKFPNTFYQFVVLCYDRNSGKEVWRQVVLEKVPHEGHHRDNDFAPASPTTDGERIFFTFASAGTYCFSPDGKLLWQRDLGNLRMQASLGEGCSPVVHNGKLILQRDQQRQSSIMVLDAASGSTIWEKPRPDTGSWATPRVIEHGGKTQIIASGSMGNEKDSSVNRVRSYDLESGELLWECGGLTSNAIPCPVNDSNSVYVMTGYQGFSALSIPLDSEGDVTGSPTWQFTEDTPYIPSPLLYGGLLYFNRSNQAIFSCIDSSNGERVFGPTRLPQMNQIYASPVAANGRVYVTGRNGTTVVLKAGRSFEVESINVLDDRVDASLAIAGDEIFIRGEKYLYCIAP
ncbi:MAG: PQQ-binding-like beta-propeller repeat protein [Planctomycetota bacterium]